MTNINQITIAGILGNVLKDYFTPKFPPNLPVDVILSPNKLALENTAGLQILVEFMRSSDFVIYNTTNNANLPAETIEKIVEEEYSIKLMAYTDDYGNNLAIKTSNWVSSAFIGQKAQLTFLENKIQHVRRMSMNSVATALDYENLVIMQFIVKVKRFTIFNTQADYYDTFETPIVFYNK